MLQNYLRYFVFLLGVVCLLALGLFSGWKHSWASDDAAPPTVKNGSAESAPQKTGPELFASHCSACHGLKGNGKGPATRNLHPKPRDFRSGEFRLVSTRNRRATRQDIERVIQHGVPGTSMQSFDDLPSDQRTLLARQVLAFWRAGARAAAIAELESDQQEFSEQELEQLVAQRTAPQETIVPIFGDPDPKQVVAGGNLYFKQGCQACHGDDGVGARDVWLVDNKRRQTRPRDLVHEPLKGGSTLESIYLRLLLGMPGTPHPSSANLTEEQLIALTHFCRSLACEPTLVSTNYQRSLWSTCREYLSARADAKK